jgi:hypothetical protein
MKYMIYFLKKLNKTNGQTYFKKSASTIKNEESIDLVLFLI